MFAQPNDSNFVFRQHTSEWMEKQKCEVCVLAKQNKTKQKYVYGFLLSDKR